jgi:hypothetical protein
MAYGIVILTTKVTVTTTTKTLMNPPGRSHQCGIAERQAINMLDLGLMATGIYLVLPVALLQLMSLTVPIMKKALRATIVLLVEILEEAMRRKWLLLQAMGWKLIDQNMPWIWD